MSYPNAWPNTAALYERQEREAALAEGCTPAEADSIAADCRAFAIEEPHHPEVLTAARAYSARFR